MKKTDRIPNMICDGEIAASGAIHVSPHSRIAAYGEGCFDTLRAYRGGFVRPDRHLERLHRGMQYLGLEIPVELRDINVFLNQLKRLLEINDCFDKEVRIRIQVWADDHTAGYRPGNRSSRYVISGSVIADSMIFIDPPGHLENFDHSHDAGISGKSDPPADPDHSVSLITSRFHKIPSTALPADVKWSNGINYILAAREAAEKNFDDALMLTRQGYVSESTIANIFWKSGDTVYTPSDNCDLLPGITRALTLEVLNDHGLPVRVGKFQPEALKQADTVWLCNSIREWYPVKQIDGHWFIPKNAFWTTIIDLLQQRKLQEMQYVR